MNILKITSLIFVAYLIVGCTNKTEFKKQLSKTLNENPELLFDIIKKNPAKFMMVVQESAKEAQKDMAQQKKLAQEKKLTEAFENPLKPQIDSSRYIRGPKEAPITIVEYSDFECPFCARGFNTVENLMKKYPGKIRFIYKHLPLNFHPPAMIAAQYFEAVALQSQDKAFQFHDAIFNEQSKLKNGEKFLTSIAKKLGVNLIKLKKDINSKEVQTRIENDLQEARKFGFSGTPGFLINGIPVKGAFPADYFVDIINKLKAKGKLNL